MTDAPHTEINFVWHVRRDGDIAYVEEFVDDRLAITYGPMPAVAAGLFIDECKQRLKDTFALVMGE